MKQLLSILLVFSLFAFVACEKTENAPVSDTTEVSKKGGNGNGNNGNGNGNNGNGNGNNPDPITPPQDPQAPASITDWNFQVSYPACGVTVWTWDTQANDEYGYKLWVSVDDAGGFTTEQLVIDGIDMYSPFANAYTASATFSPGFHPIGANKASIRIVGMRWELVNSSWVMHRSTLDNVATGPGQWECRFPDMWKAYQDQMEPVIR